MEKSPIKFAIVGLALLIGVLCLGFALKAIFSPIDEQIDRNTIEHSRSYEVSKKEEIYNMMEDVLKGEKQLHQLSMVEETPERRMLKNTLKDQNAFLVSQIKKKTKMLPPKYVTKDMIRFLSTRGAIQ